MVAAHARDGVGDLKAFCLAQAQEPLGFFEFLRGHIHLNKQKREYLWMRVSEYTCLNMHANVSNT